HDGVTGLLASDGRRVFLVEDQAHSLQQQMYSQWNVWGGGWSEEQDMLGRSFATNRLTAYDLRTGRPAWSGGGPLTDELFDVPLAGNYFFGPPLLDGRRAYAIAQKEERILLHALDAATGFVEWSAWLGFSDMKIAEDFSRRSWTAQPAVSRGIIVCPTTVGWIVAIDAASREVLWAQRFSKPDPSEATGNPETRRMEMSPPGSRWHPSAPVIAGDAVVFTPPEAQELFCFDLHDGTVRWKSPRGEQAYLAGVCDGRVVIVGGRRVSAFALDTGRALWRVDVPPEDGQVSGRGVATSDRFHLPLDSGQLWSIELATGKVTDRWFLPEGGPRLENLALYEGMLLSVGTAGATAFEQRDAIETTIRELTEKNPRDPVALLKQAEIRMLERDHSAALAALRKIRPQDVPAELVARHRAAVIDALSAIIRSAPVERAAELGELARFAESAEERFHAERLRGLHLVALDRHAEAFDLYAKLVETAGDRLVPRDDDPRVLLSEERWAAGRLGDVWKRLEESERAPRDERIGELAKRALAASRDEREAFVRRYGFHSAAPRVRSSAAEAAAAEDDFASASHALWELSRSSDESIAAAALARLARLLDDAGARADGDYFRRLRLARFPEARPDGPPTPPRLPGEDASAKPTPVASNGAARLPDMRDFAPSPDWGDFDLRLVRTGARSYNDLSQDLAISTFSSPFFRKHRFELSLSRQQLAVLDRGDDSLHWLVPLRTANDGRQQRAASWVAGLRIAVLQGRVLHMLSPIDRRVLWTHNVEIGPGGQEYVDYGHMARSAPTMESGAGIVDRGLMAQPAAYGAVPVANADYVAFRDRRELSIHDSVTGRLRWRIGGLSNGSRILGNDQAVFVVPPDGGPRRNRAGAGTLAFRARDGKPLEIPNLERLLAAALVARPEGLVLVESGTGARLLNIGQPKASVRLHDPLTGRDIWKQDLPTAAMVDLLDDETLAIAGKEEQVQLLRLGTGETQRFEDVFAPQDRPSQRATIVLADDERVFLILNREDRSRGGVYSEGLPNATVNGVLIALDRRTGKVAWRRTIDRQNLLLPNFRHSPLLTFAIRRLERNEDLSLMTAELLAVDRRDGRTLHESTFHGNGGFHSLEIDAADRHVELGSYNMRLRLMAVPPKTPPESGEKPDGG
ncbi:MAG: PQQ-binding-like beta-propeller repeat protein, partial [Planctomycetaceae bacterium]